MTGKIFKSALAIGAMVAGATAAGVGPAAAAASGNCGSSAWVTDNICYTNGGNPYPAGTVYLHVSLGSDHHYHVNGESYTIQQDPYNGTQYMALYLDISHDNGKTWTGWQDTVWNSSVSWEWNQTKTVLDPAGTEIRACISDQKYYSCTPWA